MNKRFIVTICLILLAVGFAWAQPGGGSPEWSDSSGSTQVIANGVHNATSKTTPVDADELPLWDSITGTLNKLTWANLKATLASTFAPIYVNTSITSSATPTPAVGTTGAEIRYYITALAAGATFGAPTGTPVDEQVLIIRIKDDGTARALGYNAIYRAGDTPLPTTTVISKTMYLAFRYNSADTKWDFTGTIGGF